MTSLTHLTDAALTERIDACQAWADASPGPAEAPHQCLQLSRYYLELMRESCRRGRLTRAEMDMLEQAHGIVEYYASGYRWVNAAGGMA